MGINLPNGNEVEEIILPNGANAREVIGPNGETVWRDVAIPDSVMYLPEENDLENFSGNLTDYDIIEQEPFSDPSVQFLSDVEHVIEGEFGTDSDPEIISSDGLYNYPERGDTFGVYFWQNGGTDADGPQFYFGHQSNGSNYGFRIFNDHPVGDEIILFKDASHGSSSGITVLDDGEANLSQQEWYDCEVEWGDPTITLRIFEVDQDTGERENELIKLSDDDTDYSSGSIGLDYGGPEGGTFESCLARLID